MPLQEESLDEVRQRTGPHVFQSTVKYFHGALTDAEYRACRRALATSSHLPESEKVCLVAGYGSQPRSTYARVSGHKHVELLWTGPFMPLVLWPLSLFTACQSGLLRVSHPSAARVALHQLSYFGIVELMYFSADLLDDVVRHVRRRRWKARPGFIVGTDPTYFLFGVERENPNYETRIAGWSSFGPECPSELRAIVPIRVPGEPMDSTVGPVAARPTLPATNSMVAADPQNSPTVRRPRVDYLEPVGQLARACSTVAMTIATFVFTSLALLSVVPPTFWLGALLFAPFAAASGWITIRLWIGTSSAERPTLIPLWFIEVFGVIFAAGVVYAAFWAQAPWYTLNALGVALAAILIRRSVRRRLNR